MAELAAAKQLMRTQALNRRAACDPALGAAMSDHIMRAGLIPPGAKVAAFISLPGEISTAPIITALAEENYQLCLPYTPERGLKLEFRAWQPGDKLLPGRFKTLHPEGEAMMPDVILIPLLAFDGAGNRLGYGGGYYDRTLAKLPHAFRLGLAFAAQEFPQVPAGPTDIKLHAIATENGIHSISCSRA